MKATYTVNDTLSLMGLVTNGWDNVRDNNRSKSFGGQIAVNTAPVSVFVNYVGGKERDDDHFRHTVDGIVVVRPVTGLTLTLNADWGQDEEAAGPGKDAVWCGIAAYVADRDSPEAGGITLTPELKIGKHLVLRGEVRRDSSDEKVFSKREEPKDSQTTLAFDAIYPF